MEEIRSLQSRRERRSNNNIRLACSQGNPPPTVPRGTRPVSTRSLHSEAQTASTSSSSPILVGFGRSLIYRIRPRLEYDVVRNPREARPGSD